MADGLMAATGTGDGEATSLDPTIDFIAGVVSGITGLIVGFPLDTVKVRFQNPGIARRYTSTLNAMVTIIREERFVGLFKGITSPLAAVALLTGLLFASYHFFLKLLLNDGNSVPTLGQIALAGAGSGIVTSLITTPTDLIKIRQQSLLYPSSALDVARCIFREHGVCGLYRGITATALRDGGYGAYFWTYEATCRYFTPHPTPPFNLAPQLMEVNSGVQNPSWYIVLLAGGVAGIVGWLFTFPFDVVKTRMQASSEALSVLADSSSDAVDDSTAMLLFERRHRREDGDPYRTLLSTIRNSYRAEGLCVFFRGLVPTLIRAIPVNMVTFATFEILVRGLT